MMIIESVENVKTLNPSVSTAKDQVGHYYHVSMSTGSVEVCSSRAHQILHHVDFLRQVQQLSLLYRLHIVSSGASVMSSSAKGRKRWRFAVWHMRFERMTLAGMT